MQVLREAALVILLSSCVFCVLGGRADAQEASDGTTMHSDAALPQTAKQLDAEGTREMDAGDFADGCPMLAQSHHLDPGIGVLLRLALCYERAGKVASAWTRYREASDLARRGGNPQLMELALRRAAALEPLLPTLTVRVPAVEGLRVTVDGEMLARDAWYIPVPVDPGRHEIVAVAPGMRRFVARVTSTADPDDRSFVDVALEADAAAPVETRATAGGPPQDATPPRDSSWRRTAAISLGILGAAGLVTGGIFGASAISSMNNARDQCQTHTHCLSSALGLQDDARNAAAISTVAFAAGAGAVVGGLVLWLTDSHADEHRSAWRIVPLVERHAAGIDCTTAF